MKENEIQQQLRLEATRRGWRLWRNNVGAGMMENGNFIRFGLANDTAATNKFYKSADLIGIRRVLITPDMVGGTIGQFVSVEVKEAGWIYTGTEREQAQARWADFINSMSGYAVISTGVL